MAIFNRSKFCSVDQIGPDLLEAKGTFIDTVHEINLTLQVKIDNLEILSAKADMVRVPHKTCEEAQGEDSKLVGIKIGAGSRKAVQNAVGHDHGCTHLTDLTMDLIKAVVQANYRLENRALTKEQMLTKHVVSLGGSCNFWTEIKERFNKADDNKQPVE